MDLTTIGTFISQFGFPIVVACYLLIKGSKDSTNLTAAVTSLQNMIEKSIATCPTSTIVNLEACVEKLLNAIATQPSAVIKNTVEEVTKAAESITPTEITKVIDDVVPKQN